MSLFSFVGGLLGAGIGTLVAPGIGTAIGAGIGGSIGSTADSNEMNKDLAGEAQQLTLEENARNRAFNAEQATVAFERQRQLQQEQNNWNSVQSQMQRFQAAGMNPFVAMSNGLSQASGGISVPQAASAPGSASFPFAQVQPIGKNLTDDALKIAQASQAFSQAGLNDAQSSRLLGLLEGELKGQTLDNETKELALGLERQFGSAMRSAEVDKLVFEGVLAYRQSQNALLEGNAIQAKTELDHSMAVLNQARAKTEGRQYELLGVTLKYAEKEAVARINNINSSTAANYSVSKLNNAEANRINELLPGEKLQQQVQYALTSAQSSKTWEDIKHSAVERDKMAREMAKITLECQGLTLDNEKARIYVRRYEEILDNAIMMDKQEFYQMVQDYNNPFRYVGSLLGGSGAAVIKAAVK